MDPLCGSYCPFLMFVGLNTIIGGSAVSTTAVDEITLGRCGTDTASSITRIGRRAAFGFHLVIPEHEQTVHAQSEGRIVARQRLIRVVVAVAAHAISSLQLHAIKRAHGLAIQLTRIL